MFERVSRLFGGRKRTPPAPPPEAPFEYLTVHGEAVADEMRRAAKRAGVVPVLMGTREEFAEAVALIKESPDDFDAITQAGQELNVEEWIRERREAEPDYCEIDETEDGTVEAIAAFSPARDVLTGEFRPEVFIGLIPVEAPWLVPAYLKSGGWNECPEPHVHLAFFRRWYERYGARVTTFTSDVIEFAVARPPSTSTDASELAREQFIYCADLVLQGFKTVGNLRAALLHSQNWYFWWD